MFLSVLQQQLKYDKLSMAANKDMSYPKIYGLMKPTQIDKIYVAMFYKYKDMLTRLIHWIQLCDIRGKWKKHKKK